MKLITLLTLLSLSPILLRAEPKIGKPAPDIHLDKLLPEQPVANASFKALEGKVVVVEMWATWCGSCIVAIPHLNELADKFKDRPVVFLSVSDEEPALVEAFVKKHPISGLVGVAHTESPLKSYGLDGIPATFLISSTGKVAAIVSPEQMNASILEAVLANQPLPAVELTIHPQSFGSTHSLINSMWRNSWEKSGSLHSIVSYLWETPDTRVSGEPLNDHMWYDISLSIPAAEPGDFKKRARAVIATAFNIQVKRETRETAVWILSKTAETPSLLQPAGTITDYNDQGSFPPVPPAHGAFKLIGANMSLIIQIMEAGLNNAVIDETGLSGKYDIQLSYDKSEVDDKTGSEGFIAALRKGGFKIERARRPVDFLVVTRPE